MTIDEIKEGDICVLDESVEYYYKPHKPYEVLVLWHGCNCQPLVTKVNEYKPFWTTYSQLIEIKGHIELHNAIASIEAWAEIKQEINNLFSKPAFYMLNYDAYEMFLEILNKHLQEINDEQNEASPTGAESEE